MINSSVLWSALRTRVAEAGWTVPPSQPNYAVNAEPTTEEIIARGHRAAAAIGKDIRDQFETWAAEPLYEECIATQGPSVADQNFLSRVQNRAELHTMRMERDEARAEAERLQAMVDRLQVIVDAGGKNPYDCRLIFWPLELPVPYFDGEQGNRTIAAWSMKLTRLSSGWHWMAEFVDPVTDGLKPPPDLSAFPLRALRRHVQQTGVRTPPLT